LTLGSEQELHAVASEVQATPVSSSVPASVVVPVSDAAAVSDVVDESSPLATSAVVVASVPGVVAASGFAVDASWRCVGDEPLSSLQPSAIVDVTAAIKITAPSRAY
jgi:hypothetical protein